ncbi:hypothetical protein Vadar_011413 [Vaccinium darrowii]|uniref:Uncharacterized protein n=1 Tax=Vaccinium darrowii TaxID=229202 RepID=A0ACB7Y693_9ERIC|nr:hypothetical protein Vadar_011413 [Vaccinium darrowii]
MQTLWTVLKAYNRALVAEKQEKRKFSRFGQQFQQSQGGSKSGQPYYSYSKGGSSSSGGQGASSRVSNQNRVDKATTSTQNQPQSCGSGTRDQFPGGGGGGGGWGFKCYKCGEPGHKSSDCRRSSDNKNKALFMEESCEDEFPIYDEAMCEDVGGDDEEEVGLALEKVTTKPPPTTLLASKGFVKESHETSVVDLVPLPTSKKEHPKADEMATFMKNVHAKYKAAVDAHKKEVLFKKEDLVWVILSKERHPHGAYMKLNDRKVGSCEVLCNINDNAYQVQLPSHLNISNTFNVQHLMPYFPEDTIIDLMSYEFSRFNQVWSFGTVVYNLVLWQKL